METLRENSTDGSNTSNIGQNSTAVLSINGQKDSTISRACKVLAYLCVLAIAFAGNTFIIHAMRRNHRGRLRALTYLLIASIAVSDLLMAAWSIPERITRVISEDQWLVPGAVGSLLCKAVNFIEKVSITVSALHVLALAVHRFITVFCVSSSCRKDKARKIGLAVVIVMWACALLYWSPILYYGDILSTSSGMYCRVRHFYPQWKVGYLVYLTVLLTILVLVLVLYGGISIRLCSCRTPPSQEEGCSNQEGTCQPLEGCNRRPEGCGQLREGYSSLSAATRRRLATMVAVMVIAFYGCFLPYWISWILCSYRGIYCNGTFTFISIFLSNASVAVNPIICLTFSRRYRTALVQMMRERPKRIVVLSPITRRLVRAK